MKADIEYKLNDIKANTQWIEGVCTGILERYRLYTAVQPIFSLAHKRHVGFEALVRVRNQKNAWVSPEVLFSADRSGAESVFIDRLCRYVHMQNFYRLNDHLNWLFLNVSPQTIITGKTYGSYFEDLLKETGFPAHRIVIEVVESPIGDNELLMDTINYYKSLGCLIAIDDFGAGHSNFDRIWTLKPDIVKLDRSFLVRAAKDKGIREILPGIVSLLHQSGALVLMEGVETFDQAMITILSNADFVQGFFFSKPFTDLHKGFSGYDRFDDLLSRVKSDSNFEEETFKAKIGRFDSIFKQVVREIRQGRKFVETARFLCREPGVVRCYQMSADGIQVGKTIVCNTPDLKENEKFKPLEDARSADWFRRHYLRRAKFHPEQLQVTRPYLSITGAHMCITLSMSYTLNNKDNVVCCDLSA